MKKIIPSFLLAVSASTGLLLAQVENRLEAGGYRLEEIESQIKDNRKSALPSENQIGRRVELTTNYELPTANCNNALHCYLMMNPSLEEGTKAIGEALEIFTPAQARKAAQEREAAAKASSTARLGAPTSKNLFSQSTEAAKGFVTPVLEQIVSSQSTTTCKDSMNAALDLNFDLDSMKHTALRQNSSSALPHQVFTASRNDGHEISAPESSGMPYTFRTLCSEAPCPSSASATLKTGSKNQEAFSNFSKTGGLKAITATSDEEEDAVADPDLESEDTQLMSSEVSKYLKKEIINNIYEECLAEVAKLTMNGRVTTESSSKETAEWVAAKEATEYSKRKAERVVTIATKKTEEAKGIMGEAKKSAKEAARIPVQGSVAEQAVIIATMNYEKAREAYAIADYKAKKLEEELAEARVETADANLYAINVRNTAQKITAEMGLNTAKETEMQALEAAEAAKADITTKGDLLSSAEISVNDAKKMVKGTNPTSPMTATQRAALRELEQDKAAAEEVRAKAKKAEIAANSVKAKNYEMNFEKELQSYHQAEEAWGETVEGYKNALTHAQDAGLDDEELALSVAKAEVQQAAWRADARWVKARQVDQMVATISAGQNFGGRNYMPNSSGLGSNFTPSLNQLRNAETAWAHAADGYKMAVEKATKSNLKCVELTNSLNNAMKAQVKYIIAGKRKEVEEAFARPDEEKKNYAGSLGCGFRFGMPVKSESEFLLESENVWKDAWKEAGRVAREISNYWSRVIEEIKEGKSQLSLRVEEAIEQREQYVLKEKEALGKIAALQKVTKITDAQKVWNKCVNVRTDAAEKQKLVAKALDSYSSSVVSVINITEALTGANPDASVYAIFSAAETYFKAASTYSEAIRNKTYYKFRAYSSNFENYASSARVRAQKGADEAVTRATAEVQEAAQAVDAASTRCINLGVDLKVGRYKAGDNADAAAERAASAHLVAATAAQDAAMKKIAIFNNLITSAEAAVAAASHYVNVVAKSNAENFFMVAQECVGADNGAGIFMREHWTTALSAFEREKNAWEALANSESVWKDYSKQWESVVVLWKDYEKAAKGQDAPHMITCRQQAMAAIEALKIATVDQVTVQVQLAEAQHATKEADQAFEALKLARDTVYASHNLL